MRFLVVFKSSVDGVIDKAWPFDQRERAEQFAKTIQRLLNWDYQIIEE